MAINKHHDPLCALSSALKLLDGVDALEARLQRAVNGEKGAEEILDRLRGKEHRLDDKVREWNDW